MSEIVKGYKATDGDMRCRGHKFDLGKWYSVEGELKQCENGFHFCEQMAGVWAYYFSDDTRVFECEAQEVLATKLEPGSYIKRVARQIRLVKEVTPGVHHTGHRNTGYVNTGDSNTGDSNTGDRNTGDSNTGHRNTGYGNAGYGNTGYRNTGHSNTGHRNTGHRNTGHRNTGYGNATDHCSGFFCIAPQYVLCFDVDTSLTREELTKQFPEYWDLCVALSSDTAIDFEPYKNLPGITPQKLKALHEKHIAGRNNARGQQ